MRPQVFDELMWDLNVYGSCFWMVTDTPQEFSIKRVSPGADCNGFIFREYIN